MNIFDQIYFWRKKKNKNMWETLKPIDLSKIKTINFPTYQYFQDVHDKKSIVLHHTISGNVSSVISTWVSDPVEVATCIIIDKDGTPWQLFSSKYWAYHLGLGGDHILDKQSIAIENVNWGGLILGDGTTKQFGKKLDGTLKLIQTIPGKYYAYYGNIVDVPVQNYPDGFRGYNYFEKYSDEQIITMGELLLYWNKVYGIPLTYHSNMWDQCAGALGGEPGVWSHTSFRKDKSDLHPQENLIEMLKTLEGIV